MTYSSLPFQYQNENSNVLTGFSGLPLYIELAYKSGLIEVIDKLMQTKKLGWSDREMILSLILLNLAGGDCITDINRLEQDKGLRTLLQQFRLFGMQRPQRRAYLKRWRKSKKRGLPSTAAIHRYLRLFHSAQEENKRLEGQAFIPGANLHLQALCQLNEVLISSTQHQNPTKVATLDQDATLIETYKRSAFYCYESYKAYQPFNTYWAEHGLILHSEFRDGNVPASYEQLQLLKDSLKGLPDSVEKVYLRSDSAGYQSEILQFCAEGQDSRFGVIEFAIAARVSSSFKEAVNQLKEEDWQPLYKQEPDGTKIPLQQEWAEVCFVPNWVVSRKQAPTYRYLAIREKVRGKHKGDTTSSVICTGAQNYKLFALVTNRDLPGNELIHWYRERCGKSEEVHDTQKNGLAGGQLPSNAFGANAAWWHIMILAFNLSRLMQLVALPKSFEDKKMKGLRFHVIRLPGRVIRHARQLRVKVEKDAYEFYCGIRNAIASIRPPPAMRCNTS